MFMLRKASLGLLAAFALTACSTGYNKKVVVVDEEVPVAHTGKQVGDVVYFNYDSSSLSSDAQSVLRKQAEWLHKNKSSAVIEGHCDERGTVEYNLALGERRANAVKKFLIGKGVDASKLKSVSYGKEKPAVMGHDEAAWTKNRRAVTIAE